MTSVTKPSDASGDFLIPGSADWEANIYQIDTADDVVGGPGDIANLQAWGLANRTAYLKNAVETLDSGVKAGIQHQTYTAVTTSGTAPAYTGTASPAITSYTTGQRFRLKFHSAHTGAVTLNLNALGAKDLKIYDPAGAKADPPTVPLGWLTDAEYDGTDFVLLDPLPDAGASQATKAGVQAQTYTAILTSGTAPTYVATPSPVLGSYAAGQRFRIKFHSATTIAATLNLNSLGAKSIKCYDYDGSKIAVPNIPANWLVDAEYDGTDMVLLCRLPTETGNYPTKADLQAQTYTAVTTSGTAPTYTASASPAIGAYAAGQRFRVKFHAASTGAATLNLNSLGAKSLKIYDSAGAKATPTAIAANFLTDVEYDGTDLVILNPVIGLAPLASPTFTGTPAAPTPTTGTRSTQLATMQKFADEFASSMVGNGYQKFPSGLILQWGYVISSTGGAVTVTYPIAFPNACLSIMVTNNDPNTNHTVGSGPITGKTTFSAYCLLATNGTGVVGSTLDWFAIGY